MRKGNRQLGWEKSTQTDLGIDFGFLQNRIYGEIDYYNKKTGGLLADKNLPYTTGYSNMFGNEGDMKNTGFEIVLNTKNFKTQDFSWESSFNLANNNNKITALSDNNADQIVGNVIRRVGERLDSFYLVEYAGVDSANGDALFYKNTLNADGSRDRSTTNDYSEAQRVIAGSSTPDWIAGFTNNIDYKNFDFSFTFQGEFGASIYNASGIYQSANADWFDNQTVDQMNRWQKPGDITMVPQARLGDGNGTQNSTRYLEKANFIRLRNISLGYSLDKNLTEDWGISKIRFYVSAINALTFTKYSGYDPEARSDTARGGGGSTFYSAPPAKTVTFGINVNF